MTLHTAYGVHASSFRASRRLPSRHPARHDLTVLFWSIAIPVCLAFWAAVIYGIRSAF